MGEQYARGTFTNKDLDYESEHLAVEATQPRLLDEAETLIPRCRELTPAAWVTDENQ